MQRRGSSPTKFTMATERKTLLQVFEKAAELNICPNRLWNATKEKLTEIVPDLDLILTLRKSYEIEDDSHRSDHKDCTWTLCEFSKLDFTSVQQRHECSDNQCVALKLSFPERLLDSALRNQQPTAWSLSRQELLKPGRPYMAISHVWSDGTGASSSGDGAVNGCLYQLFADIAVRYRCEGIWWDTICIPRQKAARTKAIRKIHSSYEVAKFTLVHDCFLRNWVWEPETACFAILISPWFSRGWTALELMKSRKVKVIFQGPDGPLIKDLDEDILAKEDEPDGPRKEASRIIRRLRHGAVSSINDLLNVLGSRSTSWPKDIPVIAALLLEISPTQGQQETYRNILRRLGKISPGHLFHNAVPMSNSFTWCPAEMMNMPLDFSNSPSLSIMQNGDIIGKWRVIPIPNDFENICSLSNLHGLTRLWLKDTVENFATECFLLAECGNTRAVERALVVRRIRESHFQYIAAVNVYQHMALQLNVSEERTVTILSNSESMGLSPSIDCSIVSKGSSLRAAIQRGDLVAFHELISMDDLESPDEDGRRPLHLAAEQGHLEIIKHLLHLNADYNAQCGKGLTPLHYAVSIGSTATVKLLLNGSNLMIQDKIQDTALHLAVKKRFGSVARFLVTPDTIHIKGVNGLTPLHFAAINGDLEAVSILVDSSDLKAADEHLGWTPLHCAADSGDADVVRLLLDHGADMNAADTYVGWTPFHLAVMNGHAAVVKLLLDGGINVTTMISPDRYHWTPRRFAEINGHHEVLALLPGDTNVEIVSSDGLLPPNEYFTPLHCRAINGQTGVTRILTNDMSIYSKEVASNGWSPLKFAARAELDVAINRLLNAGSRFEVEEGSTLLHWSVTNGHLAFTRSLLQANASKEEVDKQGFRPIHYASLYADGSILHALIEAGTEKTSVTAHDQETALHKAARNQNRNAIQILLESGLDKEATNIDGATPLMLAVDCGNFVAVEVLLEFNALVNGPQVQGESHLNVASRNGHESIVRMLIQAGAEIRDCDQAGRTALHLAVASGHTRTSQILVQAGARINATDHEGRTPLYLATGNGDKEMVEYLIGAGSETDHCDLNGRTALHIAVTGGYKEISKMLIQYGAETNIPDLKRRTPLFGATENEDIETVRLLIDAGAEVEPCDERKMTVLHVAVTRCNAEILELLIEAGADVNKPDDMKQTPLHYATEKGYLNIADILIDAGADPDIRDHRGYLPLHYALLVGQDFTIRLIKPGFDVGANSCEEPDSPYRPSIEDDYPAGTPLILAARFDYERFVDTLVLHRIRLDERDLQLRTALHWAALNGNFHITSMLIDAGASTEIPDRDHKLPLHLASDHQVRRLITEAEPSYKRLRNYWGKPTKRERLGNLGSWYYGKARRAIWKTRGAG